MELTVFKLTKNEEALRIAKPYLNDVDVAVERSYVKRAELSIEAKRFLHGKEVAEVLTPTIEAFVLLLLYKHALGKQGAKWVKDNRGDTAKCPVTPTLKGGGGNTKTYGEIDCKYFFKVRDSIVRLREVDNTCNIDKKNRLCYFDYTKDLGKAPPPATKPDKKKKKDDDPGPPGKRSIFAPPPRGFTDYSAMYGSKTEVFVSNPRQSVTSTEPPSIKSIYV